jgi:NitT/TauT family transport system ATP-binding protein
MSAEEKKPAAPPADKAVAQPTAAQAAPRPAPVDPEAAARALAAFEAELAGGPPPVAPAQPHPVVAPHVAAEREAPAARPHATVQATAPRAQAKPGARPHVVVFDRVTKTYAPRTDREFTAIRDVTFTVEDLPGKGEFICLLGPSGCGKSTVLRLIAGLEPQHPQTSGTIRVFDRPVTGPGADRGMVFQSYTSFDNRTVLQNVGFGIECRGDMSRGDRHDLAKLWIKKVGLSIRNDADKYPHELSGGMQQRVAIARTLILKPRIILMDEPFGALDPLTRTSMQDMVIELWREVEATVFFVTHSIEEAVYLGDRVYLFSNSPGTILREYKIPPPDRPSKEMQRSPGFQHVVYELRDTIERLEQEQKQKARS